MEADLEQEVAELLLEVVVAGPGLGIDRRERVEHLVGLLQQVRGERRVRLLTIPWAALAQHVHQLVEAGDLGRHRRGGVRHPQRRQMIGLEAAVELGALDREHRFIGQAEPLEHRDRWAVEIERELDVGQHALVVHVGDEERSPLACGSHEVVTIDEARARCNRIDAQPRPHQVEERDTGEQLDIDRRVGQQVLDRTLEHGRRAGNRVQDGAVFPRRGRDRRRDLRVDVGERIGALVDVIERCRVAHE